MSKKDNPDTLPDLNLPTDEIVDTSSSSPVTVILVSKAEFPIEIGYGKDSIMVPPRGRLEGLEKDKLKIPERYKTKIVTKDLEGK